MHNGPSTQTPPTASCCSRSVQVVALTRDETPGCLVELVRCGSCGQNAWRLDGAEVGKDRALAALSAAFAAPTRAVRHTLVRDRTPVTTRPVAARAVPDRELAGLLSGWQVLGSTS